MQEDATPLFISEGLTHAHVEQFGPIKGAISPLRYKANTKQTPMKH